MAARSSAASSIDAAAAAAAAAEAAAAAAFPTEWFVADGVDPKTGAPMRHIVLQGSVTLDHWRINLSIDPVPFEPRVLQPPGCALPPPPAAAASASAPAFSSPSSVSPASDDAAECPPPDAHADIKVHRGVYEAAEVLYAHLRPLVRAHVREAGPGARVALTGHSLGGSLATVIALMLVARGEITPEQLAPVHTFGAPAVFCEGAAAHHFRRSVPAAAAAAAAEAGAAVAGVSATASASSGPAAPSADGRASACEVCQLSCATHQHAPVAAAAAAAGAPPSPPPPPPPPPRGVLERLGLAPDAVTNVIMHRDIVPRAFVCDYTPVAGVMRRWFPGFKDHAGLVTAAPHKVLYAFVGGVDVLQPPAGLAFVRPGEEHPMLPREAALYKVTEPSCELPYGGAPRAARMAAAVGRASAANVLAAAAGGGGEGGQEQQQPPSQPHSQPQQLTLGDAVLAFMNAPHPLTTLSRYGAYGPQGTVSRYHNPQHYTDALVGLLRVGKAPAPPSSSAAMSFVGDGAAAGGGGAIISAR